MSSLDRLIRELKEQEVELVLKIEEYEQANGGNSWIEYYTKELEEVRAKLRILTKPLHGTK